MLFHNLDDLMERAKIFLIGIPKSLLDILGIPKDTSFDDLQIFVDKAMKLLSEDKERHQKIELQKELGLPIRPNQNWRELRTIARIVLLKRKKKEENNSKDKKDDNDFLTGENSNGDKV